MTHVYVELISLKIIISTGFFVYFLIEIFLIFLYEISSDRHNWVSSNFFCSIVIYHFPWTFSRGKKLNNKNSIDHFYIILAAFSFITTDLIPDVLAAVTS